MAAAGTDGDQTTTDHLGELLLSLIGALAVVAVDHEDQALGVLKVVSPKRTDLVLTPHVPHRKVDVLVLNSLNVEACVTTAWCKAKTVMRGHETPIIWGPRGSGMARRRNGMARRRNGSE